MSVMRRKELESDRDWEHFIALLLSKSPQFACICLSHSLIYVVSFVFRPTWHGNLLSSQFLGNRAGFQIGPLLTRSSDRTHFLLSLAPSRFSIKCSVVSYPIPKLLFSSSPMSSSLSIAEYFSLTSDSIRYNYCSDALTTQLPTLPLPNRTLF